LKTTYIDVLPKLADENGRVHTSFNQIVTTTGRLSSSDPNLQNIPIRTELGAKIRKAFVAQDKENYSILSADYSQIELRLLAHISGDVRLIQAFRDNVDIHTLTASKIFNTHEELVNYEMRRKAKAVNFGIIYGQTRYGLATSLGISPFEAQDFIDRYFETYPKIRQYMNNVLISAHQDGFVETILGRKRYLSDELNSRNGNIREFAERAAINAPIQGSAADLIKIAMIKLNEKLKDKKAKLILQVHDELILEVPDEELEEISVIIKDAMENAMELSVPIVADVKIGKSWKDE
ncbi:DNA polymerase I, partial [bacterium]|nr:DNA polymerase I [bacterium]